MDITINERRQARPSEQRTGTYYIRRGLSWSGIWAGVLVALALQLTGGLLAAWGRSVSTLLGGLIPLTGVSYATGIWYLAYTLLAMFTGGMVATQQSSDDGLRMTHSCAVWATATVIGFFGLALFANRMAPGIVDLFAVQAPPTGLPLTVTRISAGWTFCGMLTGLIGAISASLGRSNP